jgi:hypothetical protein
MVLNEICDDYENVDQVIFSTVAKECAKLGWVIERSDIVSALAELIEGGLAKAYQLSGTEEPEELPGMLSLDVVKDYFKHTSVARKRDLTFKCPTTPGGPSMMKVSRSRNRTIHRLFYGR